MPQCALWVGSRQDALIGSVPRRWHIHFRDWTGSLDVPSLDMPCQDVFTGREAEEQAAMDEVEKQHGKRQTKGSISAGSMAKGKQAGAQGSQQIILQIKANTQLSMTVLFARAMGLTWFQQLMTSMYYEYTFAAGNVCSPPRHLLTHAAH